MAKEKRKYVTIKISLDNLWDIILSLDDSAYGNKRLSDRLWKIACEKEEQK